MEEECKDCIEDLKDEYKKSIDLKKKIYNALVQKDTTIKAMAEFIIEFDIDEKICRNKQFNDTCGIDNGESCDCVDCIIKHFSK